MDVAALDHEIAQKITERCSTLDCEGNGSELDKIIAEVFQRLGMVETAEAFGRVECWRG